MMIYDTLELAALNWCGFNTTPTNNTLGYRRVVDGKVQVCGTTSDDLELLTMLNGWWNEGLIDPNWSSNAAGSSNIAQNQANDLLGACVMTPSTVAATKWPASTPTANGSHPAHAQTEDQIIHWATPAAKSTTACSACFSAKCKNLPLLMTFMDWQYSDSAPMDQLGPRGRALEYDENGNRRLTDFALNHEAGTLAAGLLVLQRARRRGHPALEAQLRLSRRRALNAMFDTGPPTASPTAPGIGPAASSLTTSSSSS
jgi:hypothetical protein